MTLCLISREENVEVVCPKEQQTSQDMKMEIKKAVEDLKGRKLQTLVFVFSGHHAAESGYQLGRKDECIEHKELEHLLKTLTVSKYIIFLDCCQPPIFNLDQRVCTQLNACDSRQNAIISIEKRSLFTKFLIQAFTREARGRKCMNEEQFAGYSCTECSVKGDGFITIHHLLEYVCRHYSYYLQSTGDDTSITPKLSQGTASFTESIVAYKYKHSVDITFIITLKTITEGMICNKKIAVNQLDYENMDKLKAKLFQKCLGMCLFQLLPV